jgi:hypothetical protein
MVPMNRLRRWSTLAGLVLMTGLLTPLRAQDAAPAEKKGDDKAAEKWLVDRAVTVSPARAPVPALKYRLYPSAMERKEGNAVPLYLRFAHERSDARKKELREKPEEWNKLAPDRLPLNDVKAFIDGYKYNFRQLELGARRKSADWAYTLDAGDPIGLLLPDIQEMRMQNGLLALKARLETAEGRYADAVRTLETGFSFTQQLSAAPFLICGLVSIAGANQLADALLDLEERPDAPNLYWAMTVLPRPLVDLRHENEFEQDMLEMQFPDLADLERPRSAEQWNAALGRFRKELERIGKISNEGQPPKAVNPITGPAEKSPDLPAARKYLTETVGIPAAKVEAMPAAQILLLYVSHFYHEYRDEVFKATYLPFTEGRPLSVATDERLKAVPDTEAGRLVSYMLPAVTKVRLAEVRFERRIAMQRVIEALRMHAAQAGRLPDKLDEVTAVPVPNDPGTGKPFEYQRDGATATLASRLPGESLMVTGLRYRIALRK